MDRAQDTKQYTPEEAKMDWGADFDYEEIEARWYNRARRAVGRGVVGIYDKIRLGADLLQVSRLRGFH